MSYYKGLLLRESVHELLQKEVNAMKAPLEIGGLK